MQVFSARLSQARAAVEQMLAVAQSCQPVFSVMTMAVPTYDFSIDQCDVPAVRHAALAEYRKFRSKCLEYINGDAPTSVMNQVHDLAWHTAVFRTLNEGRRLEPDRRVSGALWELTTTGYASLMTLGIRRLVDRDPRTDSIWNVLAQVEKRPELLTREFFVSYDGLPFDYEAVMKEHIASLKSEDMGRVTWQETRGPKAWSMSELMHKAFDRMSTVSDRRKRSDKLSTAVVAQLRAHLEHPAIKTVCTLADKRMAHAERLSASSGAEPVVTYQDIDDALRQLVQVANYVSANFFYDSAFGSVVATPQFDVLEGLDQPWVTTESLPALHQHWRDISSAMDAWADDASSLVTSA